MSARSVSLLLGSLLVGCAARAGAPAAPLVGSAEAGPGAAPAQGEEPSGAPSAARAPNASAPPAPLPGGEEPTPDKALPELRVEALGMHIGGGSNTPAEKAPFHRALERSFPAFLECYRGAEDPWAGGSFGVDIKVPRAGGAPTLEQPRTKIRGVAFRDCMLLALSRVQFEKPKAGPTVLSYSVAFTLGKAKR
ncbi:MAG: hypothetical protein EOO73_14435 [Myxococcales bacterium]|nr:MAG: hypothetical protein EOO73_14435 [Myxococcales bacterium]